MAVAGELPAEELVLLLLLVDVDVVVVVVVFRPGLYGVVPGNKLLRLMRFLLGNCVRPRPKPLLLLLLLLLLLWIRLLARCSAAAFC